MKDFLLIFLNKHNGTTLLNVLCITQIVKTVIYTNQPL